MESATEMLQPIPELHPKLYQGYILFRQRSLMMTIIRFQNISGFFTAFANPIVKST
ncbi:hypothetical protein CLOBOL_02112 [Enterocloster bolteae ATCC BAA-613]|jgi:hypothetical protein|uniref:Uncharacterized protein n=1 Tax=Enterocloster bolteae (strain ATCC BAA-613 / DSM 15670 / CCUG 46953 / JCM 12243 / WAL 16351) TaxID=411902 RepID=A8RN64_ENTBW|nr:hypothetical protein CLOBOL_02112 [Enterocloster bolteae ATCC BAA-613]